VLRIIYEWDPAKAESNLQKHGVSFENACAVFLDRHLFNKFDRNNSYDEERWITIGLDSNGNPLLVVHIHTVVSRELHVIRIISARKPTKREAQAYWEGRTP
jgi:uncharacterized protein